MSTSSFFNSAFTWGKGLGYVTGDDGNVIFLTTANLRRNYAPNDFDRKLNFEQSFTYELPVGRGHKYLSTGVGAFVLGGWKLAGTVSAVSGLPFSVYANGGTLQCRERSAGQYGKEPIPRTGFCAEQCFDLQELPDLA